MPIICNGASAPGITKQSASQESWKNQKPKLGNWRCGLRQIQRHMTTKTPREPRLSSPHQHLAKPLACALDRGKQKCRTLEEVVRTRRMTLLNLDGFFFHPTIHLHSILTSVSEFQRDPVIRNACLFKACNRPLSASPHLIALPRYTQIYEA